MTGGRETVTAEVAAAVLRAGGIVAHPTEAVWGLACDPASEAATLRLLALKQRSVDKGLILVAASPAQLDRHVDWTALPPARRDAMLASWPGPNTWIVPASAAVPAWIRGAHASVAVRVTAHAPAAALCTAFGGAIVSTSANPAGAPPPHAFAGIDPAILQGIDAVLEGGTGSLDRPTTIRDALTGAILR